ncbi:BspA family leucine-rich repeat surface protein [Marispirochaeta sp.]|uniref:BspA family leucine-rich repeat surface protein n=1 Tax=Marispirochaeta sp. TaxID=2038653 RepID=UPI0029C77299|nr:BspA family leucine-rich repeat surface protein [Marispirochaeta sp.]
MLYKVAHHRAPATQFLVLIMAALTICISVSSCQGKRFSDEDAFVTVWNTELPGITSSNQIQLPLAPDGEYDFQVDWGDGKRNRITKYDHPKTLHTYKSPGKYTITVTGKIRGFGFHPALPGDNGKLVDVIRWGPVILHDDGFQFQGISLTGFSATDTPDLSQNTNLQYMFYFAEQFNNGISNWDVSNITNMNHMFWWAKSFNQDIGVWDVRNVSDMTYILNGADSFDQDLSIWENINMAAISNIPKQTSSE